MRWNPVRGILLASVGLGLLAGAGPARAQLVTPYLIAMLSGPINDATVILVKKRPNFISWETPVVACSTGVGAGVIATVAPPLIWRAGATAAFDWVRAVTYPLYGCVISAVGGLGAATTEWLLVSAEPPRP